MGSENEVPQAGAEEQQPAADAEGAQDATQQGAEKAAASVELVSVKAVTNDYYDPFKRIHFRQGEVVETVLDGWLQAQIDAGYVVRV